MKLSPSPDASAPSGLLPFRPSQVTPRDTRRGRARRVTFSPPSCFRAWGRAKAGLVLVSILVAFSGCVENAGNASSKGSLTEYPYELHDGRTVYCVAYHDHPMGGLSCDWASAR